MVPTMVIFLNRSSNTAGRSTVNMRMTDSFLSVNTSPDFFADGKMVLRADPWGSIHSAVYISPGVGVSNSFPIPSCSELNGAISCLLLL